MHALQDVRSGQRLLEQVVRQLLLLVYGEQNVVPEGRSVLKAGHQLRVAAEGQIQFPPRKRRRQIRGACLHQLQLHPGPNRGKLRQRPGQQIAVDKVRAAHADPAGPQAAQILDLPLQLFLQVAHPADGLDIRLARLGQFQGVAAAVKELRAQARLHPLDRNAQRRLGHVQLLRSLGKAPLLPDLPDIPHFLFHVRSSHISNLWTYKYYKIDYIHVSCYCKARKQEKRRLFQWKSMH